MRAETISAIYLTICLCCVSMLGAACGRQPRAAWYARLQGGEWLIRPSSLEKIAIFVEFLQLVIDTFGKLILQRYFRVHYSEQETTLAFSLLKAVTGTSALSIRIYEGLRFWNQNKLSPPEIVTDIQRSITKVQAVGSRDNLFGKYH